MTEQEAEHKFTSARDAFATLEAIPSAAAKDAAFTAVNDALAAWEALSATLEEEQTEPASWFTRRMECQAMIGGISETNVA